MKRQLYAKAFSKFQLSIGFDSLSCSS